IISCGDSVISVSVSTRNSFYGNIYAKGFFQKEECRRIGNGVQQNVDMVLPLNEDCGIRRKRMVNPRGLMLETTIVVMFHRIFLTKVDRIFHLKCFYMEADMTVEQSLDVSAMPTTELFDSRNNAAREALMPICKYEVLKGGADGEPLKYATIGELVYHKWTCSGVYDAIYCMTVHSCVVDDGQGNRQEILDERGCGTDPYLLNDLEYLDQLSAGQEAQVFKFADRPSVFFSCQIRLELRDKVSGQCDRTSDLCKESVKNAEKDQTNADLSSSTVVSRVDLTVHLTSDGLHEFVDEDFPQEAIVFTKQNINIEATSQANEFTWNTDEMNIEYGTERTRSQTPSARQQSSLKTRRMSKRISRETAHRFAINLDVAAPSVDVFDLSERTPRSDELKDAEEDLFNNDTEVCISRVSLFTFGGLIIVVLIATIALAASVVLKNLHKGHHQKRMFNY
uniref:ZP domain-containing protein n=2 Tax=Parascaris univalens TaxID=6257 RepID=A0A915ATU2_PARUN